MQEQVQRLIEKIKTLSEMALPVSKEADIVITIRNQEPAVLQQAFDALKDEAQRGPTLHKPGENLSMDKYWFGYAAAKGIYVVAESPEFKVKTVVEPISIDVAG